MAQLLLRLLNLLALLASTAWLARAPSYAALATFLALLAVLVGQEIASAPSHKHAADMSLFQQFLEVLPSNGRFIHFLRDHDIGAPFEGNVLDNMYRFLAEWGNAEHEFKIKRLEKLRSRLFAQTAQFSKTLSLAIFRGSDRFYSMDLHDYEDRPNKLKKRDELNAMATNVYNAHQELVRVAKQRIT